MTRHFFFSNNQNTRRKLAVHLAWCQHKDASKPSHILPILTPVGDIHAAHYGVDHPETGKPLRFSLDTYIKACAKKIVTGYGDSKPPHPDCWQESEYDFTAAKLCFGTLRDCIEIRGVDLDFFVTCKFHDFNDMLALYVMDEGTIPVTYNQLEAATREVEKPLNEKISKKSAKQPSKKPSKKSSKKKDDNDGNSSLKT